MVSVVASIPVAGCYWWLIVYINKRLINTEVVTMMLGVGDGSRKRGYERRIEQCEG